MSRGDQRDRDRQKRQAREASKNNVTQREGTPQQRNADDKAALLAKLEAKKAKQLAEPLDQNANIPVPRKKGKKQSETLDDLLSAGLAVGKKKKK
ncbi:unnamed protein product [Cylindrotheca closterium]|uniref:Small EDRK-rich factor-like N-terminal domain-containing protein n=1 Tax=Cylindrotheca closterium TaxID=2856 RepID=A0AAD2JP91_9STRA|nr:unnamed protein product [Cylindrotheca closterium]